MGNRLLKSLTGVELQNDVNPFFRRQKLGRSLEKRDCRVQPYKIGKLGCPLKAMRMEGLGLGSSPQGIPTISATGAADAISPRSLAL